LFKDLPNDNESDIEGVNMLSALPISEQRISEIQQYTLNDEQMQAYLVSVFVSALLAYAIG
jgi:hypothetical protein